MELLDKLNILADAAKYDAACTSSGLDRSGRPGTIGSTTLAGCCHSFSADGRCISLLKVLQTSPGQSSPRRSCASGPWAVTAGTISRGCFSPQR